MSGLEEADLELPDTWVPAARLVRLLELSAVESRREDFGLELAQWRRLSTIGPLSVVLREEPDVRSALHLLIRYEHRCSEAIRISLSQANGQATVRVRLELGEPLPGRQAVELVVAALLGGIRWLREPQGQPQSVCFTHPPPADLSEHRRLLGPALRFDDRCNGLVFSARALNSPNALADSDDPGLRTYTHQFLRSLPNPRTQDLDDRVRELIQALLPLRRCTMRQVARALSITTRTLHRHLEAGRELHIDRRRRPRPHRRALPRRPALHHLRDLRPSGFAAPSAFSRWPRRWFGMSPTAWRAATRALT